MVWNEDKILLLKDEYAYGDLDLLAKKLGVTKKAVIRKAQKLQLYRAKNNQIIDGYKFCSLCQIEHPVDQFYRNKAKYDGLEYHCKKYYKLKKEKQNHSQATSLLNNKRAFVTETGVSATERTGHSSKRPRSPIIVKNEVLGKICNKCKEWKPLNMYWNSKNGIAGKRAVCISCLKK